jgi:energy-coupling factor transport system ATP-binding protein
MLLTYYVTGFPMDLMHGVSTALFLLLVAEPMLEKLDRIKLKYGMLEYKNEI